MTAGTNGDRYARWVSAVPEPGGTTFPTRLHANGERSMTRTTLAAALLACLALSGCAKTGDARSDSVREVTVTMSEYAFIVSDSVFEAGVPYRFILKNEGKIAHELAVVPRGDADESNLIFEVEEEDLPTGATIVREFMFAEPGEYDFACFIVGHYEGGMVLPIRVVASE